MGGQRRSEFNGLFQNRAVWFCSILLFCLNQIPEALAGHENAGKLDKSSLNDLVYIPAGPFIMGDNNVEATNKSGEFGNTKPWYVDEHPQHSVNLPAYYIENHEVTNAQYRRYVAEADATPPDNWLSNGYILSLKKTALDRVNVDKLRRLAADVFHVDKDTRTMSKADLITDIVKKLDYMDNLPVTFVNWRQASDFCDWEGLHLPSEEQWEKAARGPDGLKFPWGNEFRRHLSNTGSEDWEMGVAPVMSYASDKSPYGVYDLAGNVSEWVADWYRGYPGSDYQSKAFGEFFKVARGAGWSGGEGHYALQLFQRGAYRSNLPPEQKFDDVGFRCAADDTPEIHALLTVQPN
jgi:formylglycine-generating enzyme required for sulfatase activity